MFESVSAPVHRDARTRFFGALPVSLLVHGLALAAVPLGAAWKVTFPTQAPTMMAMYSLVEPPPHLHLRLPLRPSRSSSWSW
jgi:hypothetical protein